MYKLPTPILQDINTLYKGFNLPACQQDCGEKCQIYNPHHKPFCCDPEYAIPALFSIEYAQLEQLTNLWLPAEPALPGDEPPEGMQLHRCLGPQHCQRDHRSISCRSFPFFPYVTSSYEFLGLVIEWQFRDVCWLANNLKEVDKAYKKQFISTYDQIFVQYQDVFDNYHEHSIRCRAAYSESKTPLIVLHRNGKVYQIDPVSERRTNLIC